MHRSMIFLFALALAAGASPVLHAEELDLSAYLHRVAIDNPDLILSRLKAAAAVETSRQARSALLPAVGASGSYTRSLHDITVPTPVASLPGGGPLVYQDVKHNMDNDILLSVGVTQNLFNAEALARYEQARRNSTIQSTLSELTRENILTAGKKLYAQVQLAQAVAEVRKAAEETSHAVYLNMEMKFNAGTTTELDLRMAEVDWKSDVTSTAEANRDAQLAVMALKVLAGIPLSDTITLKNDDQQPPDVPEMPAIESVLAARADFRVQLLAQDMADVAYRASIGSFLPTVTGNFSYAYGSQGNKSSLGDYTYTSIQLGLNVTIPIYTGGYRNSLIQSAKIQQSQSEIEVRKKREEIEQTLVSLHLRMQEARKRIDSARSLQSVARRAASLAGTSLATGLGTQLSVSQANTRFAQAQLGLDNALYEYRAAYYDWQLATGGASTF
ncbi:MAG TPA: TolC family protein [Spirochaetia bacterium]|nr:TolC family protein [Spirochaetia bacterium]